MRRRLRYAEGTVGRPGVEPVTQRITRFYTEIRYLCHASQKLHSDSVNGE